MKFSISKFLFYSKIIYARIGVNSNSDVTSNDFGHSQKLVTGASSTATSEPRTQKLQSEVHFPAGRISPKENYITFIKKSTKGL